MRLRAEAPLSSPLMLARDPFVQKYPSELCEPGSQSQKQLLFQCLAARSAACRARASVIPADKGKFYVCIGKYAPDGLVTANSRRTEFRISRRLTAHRCGILSEQNFAG